MIVRVKLTSESTDTGVFSLMIDEKKKEKIEEMLSDEISAQVGSKVQASIEILWGSVNLRSPRGFSPGEYRKLLLNDISS